jgi:hypothetical protein
MSEKNTGGPAFPSHGSMGEVAHEGMTLRDYFAAKAMQGIATTLDQTEGEPFWNVIATDAYKMADAMIAARSQQ